MRFLVVVFVLLILFVPVQKSSPEVSAQPILSVSQTARAAVQQVEGVCESPYIVSSGESLSRIAYRCKVSQAEILRSNPNIRNPNRVYAGQRLILPVSSATGSVASNQPLPEVTVAAAEIPVTGEQTYTIQRGDTLGRIAASAGLSVEQVMWANPSIVDPNRIYPGQVLQLPVSGSMPSEVDWRADRVAASIERQRSSGLGYQPKSAEERWIHVDLATQTVHAYKGDQIVRSFVSSTGKARTPTVTGTYPIWIKLRYDDMRGPGYNLKDVPNVMYFYRGYGLHGTYWHNNFGTPMSAGCVNLSIEDSAWLFDFASVGTIVNVE